MSDQDLTSPTTDPFATAPAAEQVVADAAVDELPAEEVAEAIIEAEEAIEDAEEIVEAEAEAEVVAEAEAIEEAAEVVEAEELEEEDPVAAFREQMRIAPGDWYVIHSYAGYENKVKGNIETRITTMNMEDYIFQVEVPMEEVTEIKSGVRKLVRRNKFPGYVLVRMDLTDESWGAIRHTPGVTGFVGHGHQPAPLSLDEVVNILAPDPREEARRSRRRVVVRRGIPCPAGGGRLRGRRLRHRGRWPVRHPPRHHLRDQHRGPEGHRPRRDLRSRDSCRAGLQPGRQELAAQHHHTNCQHRTTTRGRRFRGNHSEGPDTPWHRRRRRLPA